MHYLCSNENSSTSLIEWALAKVRISKRIVNVREERTGQEIIIDIDRDRMQLGRRDILAGYLAQLLDV